VNGLARVMRTMRIRRDAEHARVFQV
jgi:hypothetical protein